MDYDKAKDLGLLTNSTGSLIPTSDDTLLTREKLAEALKQVGLQISALTLATKASRGGGPPYCIFANRALYRWGDAMAWAKQITSATRRSTSELDAKRATGDVP